MTEVSVILLAGGSGSRMQQSVPKQFLPLAGRPMILHTLERFEKIEEIGEIVVVCLPQYREQLEQSIASYALQKKYVVVGGGTTRQESTYFGLLAAQNDCVIIHEAARPFVTCSEFTTMIRDEAKTVTYGVKIPFTVSVTDGETITGLLERDALVNVQLPQKFERKALLAAHERAREEKKEFTEDTSLLYHYTGEAAKVLKGTNYNVKVTDSVDLLTGEIIYKEYIIGRD